MLTFNEYQDRTNSTAIYPDVPAAHYDIEHYDAMVAHKIPVYPFLGLAEEAGEVMGKLKKSIRDNHTYEQVRANIRAELGDVLWYVARCAQHFNIPMSDIAQGNLDKLNSRKERGALQGSGDNR